MKRINLSGEWLLYGKDENGNNIKATATVPGCVHTDLQNCGILGDIFKRDNSKTCQWIENNDFSYEKIFEISEIYENAYIKFDGVDTYCDIYLNDIQIGSCDDMHIPYSFAVDGIIKFGNNKLTVKFRSPIKEVESMPERHGAFTTERMNTRRIQCTYGWDWVDRFVTMGIYRPCYLEFYETADILSHYIYTNDINPYTAQLHLTVKIRSRGNQDSPLSLEVIDDCGKTVFKKERIILENILEEYIDIVNPKLWYPNGYGEQPLYTLILKTPTDESISKFGVRKFTLIQPVDEEDSDYYNIATEIKKEDFLQNHDKNKEFSSFTLLCNNVKIMCKGANWVPCEPFPSAESAEKIEKLIKLGKNAGVNMLRVWGGGIFEIDEFYDLCDKYGIIVTQDFLMACGSYPEDEKWFIEALNKETEAAALRLRNHTCLAWWSGDNENAVRGNENTTNFKGYRAANYGILPILRRLDPQRYFLPSSPYGGDRYCSATRGTTHNTYYLGALFGYVKKSDFNDFTEYFNKYFNRFNAEQPALGMPFVSSLRKFLTDEDIFGDDTTMSEFHTKNNPGFGGTTIYEYIDMMTKKLFGDYKNGADRVIKMQYLQCEWIRLSLELFRRRKWYSSGIVYWMFNDCWPAANGWSILDYYANPKPSYYVFARCSKPVIASFERKGNKLDLFVCNDGLTDYKGKGKIYLYDFKIRKSLFEDKFEFISKANESYSVFSINGEKYDSLRNSGTILLCDIEGEFGFDRAFFIDRKYADLDLVYKYPEIDRISDKKFIVKCDAFLPFAICDTDDNITSDNCFTLINNGEEKIIEFCK